MSYKILKMKKEKKQFKIVLIIIKKGTILYRVNVDTVLLDKKNKLNKDCNEIAERNMFNFITNYQK